MMSPLSRPLVCLLGLAAAAACTDEAPAEPTWADVSPVLAAHCVRCHGAPALGSAPATFRLDRYDDLVTLAPDGTRRLVLGAASMAEWIADRAADGSMPPRFPLAQHDRDLLDNWFTTRASDGEGELPRPARGPARPDNRSPVFTVTASPDERGLRLAYELRDPDRDLVTGQLTALRDGAAPLALDELHAGRGALLLDTALLDAGRYQLEATLDDGPGPTRRPAGALDVVPPRPAPPRLTLLAPEQGQIVAARELPLSVEVLAADADTAQLALTVTLLDDRAATVPVATVQRTVAAGSRTRVTLGDPALSEGLAGLGYRVTAELSDGASIDRAQGGRFRISRDTTAESFRSIADDILGPYCLRCHASSPRVPNLGIDLSRYRGTADSPGAYELRHRIFHRAVVSQDMPPGSARLEGNGLPEEARVRLAAWLLAGAPEVSP